MDRVKINSQLLKLSLVTIIVCWIIKICGSTIFVIPSLEVEVNYYLELLINDILYCINWLLVIIIVVKRKLNIKEVLLIIGTATFVFILGIWLLYIKCVFEVSCLLIITLRYIKGKPKRKYIIELLFVSLCTTLLQIISMSYRGLSINVYTLDFTVITILSLDFYIVMFLIMEYAICREEVFIYEKCIKFILGKRKHGVTVTISIPEKECYEKPLYENREIEDRLSYKIFLIVFAVVQFLLVYLIVIVINWIIGLFIDTHSIWLQFAIIFVVFAFMRATLGKSYHSNSVTKCTSVAVLTFTCATQIALPTYISVQINILIGFLLAFIMYKLYTEEFNAEADRLSVCRGMDKEQMVIICDRYNINGLSRDIMIYFYCDRHKVDKIAFMVGYSNDNVAKLKKQALDMIK